MTTIREHLGKKAVKAIKEHVYVPYCKHTKKPGDKCAFHCRPGKEFMEWQSQLREAKKIAKENRRQADSVEHLFDVIFGKGNH